MEHIEFDKIQSYIEKQTKGPEFAEIEGHLAVCDRCNEIYMELQLLEKPLCESFEEAAATPSCPEDWAIAALVRDELSVESSAKCTDHLMDCSFCIDRAAHYYRALSYDRTPVKTPEPWKQKAVQTIRTEQSAPEPGVSLIQRILSFFPDLPSPLPAAAGFAAALLAIAAVTWIIIPGESTFTSTFASNEKIVIRSSEIPQSFGFTGTGETREVQNMDITLNSKAVVFKWVPIEGVSAYEFSLRDKTNSIYQANAGKDAVISIDAAALEDDRPYNWLIRGSTEDGRYIEYTGDIIFSR